MGTSNDSVPMQRILEATSLDQLKDELISARVESLARSGFKQLQKFFDDRFQVKLAPAVLSSRVGSVIATRNAIVHTRSVVDDQYRQQTHRFELKLGDAVPIDGLKASQKTLDQGAVSIYRAFATKSGRPDALPGLGSL